MWVPSLEDIVQANVHVIAASGGLIGLGREGRATLQRILDEWRAENPSPPNELEKRAASVLRRISQDQPFVDGNKRTAYAVAVGFLLQNGLPLAAKNEELLDFLPKVKEGWVAPDDVVAWIVGHVRKPKG